jgi:hypothetical protein
VAPTEGARMEEAMLAAVPQGEGTLETGTSVARQEEEADAASWAAKSQ